MAPLREGDSWWLGQRSASFFWEGPTHTVVGHCGPEGAALAAQLCCVGWEASTDVSTHGQGRVPIKLY